MVFCVAQQVMLEGLRVPVLQRQTISKLYTLKEQQGMHQMYLYIGPAAVHTEL